MTNSPPRIMFTSRSPADAARLERLFARAGWASIHAQSAVQLADHLARAPISVVVLSETPGREAAVDVCRRIRLEPAWDHVPVLARLEAPSTATMTACLDQGADACLPTSAEDEALHLRIRALLRQTTEPSELPPWTDGRRLRILAIDDDAVYLDLLCAALELDAHEVLTALDGETGLRLARLAPCDCAIIDRRLPGLDGLDVCRGIAAMRHDANWFPIVVLTAIDDPLDRQVAFELGIDEFILKSDGMMLIRARIAAVIRRRAMLTARRAIAKALAERDAAAAEARAEADSARRQAEMAHQLAAVNRELVAARDDAIKAARSRSEFLANMSHELRTPLHAIIGTVSLVADALVECGRAGDLEVLSASAEHLLAVINQILDFSKLDAGRTQLEIGEVDVGACVDGALLMVAPAANAKRLEILTDIADDAPKAFLGDAPRLRQVLINLLANAVKFTARGEVRLSVRAYPRRPDLVDLEVAIADTGPGIPKSVQEKLFLPFVQADESTSRVYGGTGLGLAISRKSVELMGGRLGVESAPGEGATFSFRIPVTPVHAKRTPPVGPPARELEGRTIVVAVANERARNLFSERLRSAGARTVEISSLVELSRYLEREAPSAVLLDAWLDGAGVEGLVDAVRRRQPTLPLVLFTGAAVPERPHVITIQKPVRSERLPALVGRGFVPRVEAAPAPRPRLDDDFAEAYPLRILVVEDNAFNLRVLHAFLSRLGYDATLAAGGAEGVAAALRAPYDVVLLDIQMPEVDGLQVSRALREHHPKGSLWICAMTATSSVEERERCIDAGMDDFVSKPVPVETLREALSRAWRARSASSPGLPVLVVGDAAESPLVEELRRSGYRVTHAADAEEIDGGALAGAPVVVLSIDAAGANSLVARVRRRLPSPRLVGWTELHADRNGYEFLARHFQVDLVLPRDGVATRLSAELAASEDLSAREPRPGRRIALATTAGVLRLESDLAHLVDALDRLRAQPGSPEHLERARALAHVICGLAGSVGFSPEGETIALLEDELKQLQSREEPAATEAIERLLAIAQLTRDAVLAPPKERGR